jgi:hypothetical protein
VQVQNRNKFKRPTVFHATTYAGKVLIFFLLFLKPSTRTTTQRSLRSLLLITQRSFLYAEKWQPTTI